ncbi:Aste57867_14781 [Aphanomyces stellatus]|uniref:Aste57867_14781 protein n=1 Tax=Aphanomyces stellatus TaxID=120398 RepID=A0A485L2E4_9STRA|nr:hypothetical protein As57867_014726 [Aphanomyces stellatus]VFT91599.1 Aste57867_14781 [Aphanomyces stellatus]
MLQWLQRTWRRWQKCSPNATIPSIASSVSAAHMRYLLVALEAQWAQHHHNLPLKTRDWILKKEDDDCHSIYSVDSDDISTASTLSWAEDQDNGLLDALELCVDIAANEWV